MEVLLHQEIARFRDLRSSKTDTNLFSYHLQTLIKAGYVRKLEVGYTLSKKGLIYISQTRFNYEETRTEPKLITMLLIQSTDGDILLQKRNEQPYINTWTLPYGEVRMNDGALKSAARRNAKEKLGIEPITATHVGDAYVRVYNEEDLLSATSTHLFRYITDDIRVNDESVWVSPYSLSKYPLAPAISAIVARCFFGDAYFFEEYDEQWLLK